MIPIEYERVRGVIVWRVIAAHRRQGHWEYMYDDYVLTPKMQEYVDILTERGAERITMKRLGPFENVIMNDKEHLVSAESVANERRNHTLDNCRVCKHWHPGFTCECGCTPEGYE